MAMNLDIQLPLDIAYHPIFVPPARIELAPFACKTNTLPLRQGGKYTSFPMWYSANHYCTPDR